MTNDHRHVYGDWRRVDRNGLLGWERKCTTTSACPFVHFTTIDPKTTDPFERALNNTFGFADAPGPTTREITWVELASGHRVEAHKLVCPICEVFDLDTTTAVTGATIEARCPAGHTWEFFPEDSLA